MSEQSDQTTLAEMTAEIVSAFVSHNQIKPTDVGNLIGVVAGRLATLGAEEAAATPPKPEPAVPIRRSVGKDEIICLICAKKQKLLKKHLASAHGLTPDQYRELFGLKSDYPMVAPNYAAARSEMARRIGLGRPRKPRAATKRAPRAKAAAK